MTIITRRAILLGIGSAIAAPAIVRVESLMPVRALEPRGFLTLAEYMAGYEAEMLEQLMKATSDLLIYGNSAIEFDGLNVRHVPLQELLTDA